MAKKKQKGKGNKQKGYWKKLGRKVAKKKNLLSRSKEKNRYQKLPQCIICFFFLSLVSKFRYSLVSLSEIKSFSCFLKAKVFEFFHSFSLNN